MKLKRALAASLIALSLAGCEGAGTGETVGTVGGAAAGALLGSQVGSGRGQLLAVLGGTLAGGYLGNRLGQRFDDRDRQRAAEAERDAIVRNEPTTWRGSDSGLSGEVRPTRTYTDASGRQCREYTHTVMVDGRPEAGTGVACRQADGSWMLEQ